MKKKLLALTAGALLTMGFAGNALAYFGDYELVRVVYHQGGSTEVATDLGNVNALAGQTNAVVGSGAAAFSLSQFSGATSTSNLFVAYFAKAVNADTTKGDIWTSAANGLSTGPLSGNRQWSGVSAATQATIGMYAGLGGSTGTVAADQSNVKSYWKSLDKGTINTAGKLSSFFSSNIIEANLADLATQGYVDQDLYFYDTPDAPKNGVKVASIRTMADGSTIINYQESAPVPVPAAAYLLGSGLLGMIGLRRKNVKK
jgi:hypothetical protein